MDRINTIRDAVDAFRLFMEDRTGRLHSQVAYPPKLIYYHLNIHRAALETELSRRKGTGDLGSVFTIPCIGLREVDLVECPCAPASGCSFYKSEVPLPQMVGGRPHTVTNADGSVTYDYIQWHEFRDKLRSRHPAERSMPYYCIRIIDNDRWLYLYGSTAVMMPRVASVQLTPYDALDLLSLPDCDGVRQVCSPLDEVFHISKEIESAVFERTLRTLAAVTGLATGADIINNDNNDSKINVGVK